MSKQRLQQDPTAREASPETPRAPRRAWRTLLPVIVIVAVWLVIAVLIDPRGNFPLNDDWGFSRAVHSLVVQHDLHYVEIITMTMISQVLWGAMFCKLFGFSHTILRISTLVLALLGIIATHRLLREAGVSRPMALIGCLVLIVNPLFLELSYTFMTDVPFAAFSWIAVCFFAIGLKRDSVPYVILGTLFATAAALTRQLGALLPIAFALAYVAKNGFRLRTAPLLVLPTVVAFASIRGFQAWLEATDRLPSWYNMQFFTIAKFFKGGPLVWGAGVVDIALHSFIYVGLFLLPVLIATLPYRSESLTRRQTLVNTAVSLISGIGVLAYLWSHQKWMPLKNTAADILQNFGLGPYTLRDVFVFHLPHLPTAPKSFWIAVTVAAIIGGSLLVWRILEAVEVLISKRSEPDSANQRAMIVLALSSGLLYLGPMVLLITFHYIDRYFITVIPFFILPAVMSNKLKFHATRACLVTALAVMLLYGAFSIGATHDYMSMNRARLAATDDLMKKDKIHASLIDGGFEFNGWYNYREGIEQNWWHLIYDDYTIAFGPMRKFRVMRSYPYSQWMPPGEGHIYVLRRSRY